jgi:hypothetical protein
MLKSCIQLPHKAVNALSLTPINKPSMANMFEALNLSGWNTLYTNK